MIIGIDLGNYSTKSSTGRNYISKVSRESNILNNTNTLVTMSGTYYMEEGAFDTEYRKIKKQYLKEMFINAVAMSSKEANNQVIVGLPLSQYKEDKDELKNILLKDKMQQIIINGKDRKIIIEDLEVYPEGVGALIGSNFNGVLVDIGGLTTDVALLEDNKVRQPYSLAAGTLNLYSDFIKVINNKYSLDLKAEDASRIMKSGLKIYGETKDITFALDVFKTYIEGIVNELQVSYSIKTLDVKLIGGGSELLFKSFKNRIPQAQLINNSIFANAIGFKKWGDDLWL